jgi:6-phosphofructokinase 1
VLARRLGLTAADLALGSEFGLMAALVGYDVVAVPLAEATAQLKVVPPEWYDVVRAFFG